jgi:hypothetical protein
MGFFDFRKYFSLGECHIKIQDCGACIFQVCQFRCCIPASSNHFVPTCDILSNELLSSDSQNHIILLHISAGRSNSYPKPEEHPVISQTLGSILQVLVEIVRRYKTQCRNNGDDLKS